MGYYTRYSLKVEPKITDLMFKEKFNKITGDCEYDYVFEEDCKWNNHEEHMLEVSKLYPEHLFMLEGEGEESGDIWRKYFFNGKYQICNAIITFEPFDETKLK